MKPRKLSHLLGWLGLLFIAAPAFAAEHFFIQMENRSARNATISFQQVDGNVFLEPTLVDRSPLAAHKISDRYGVHIEPLDPKSNFNIVFTGRKACTFNVAFYAPGKPKITTYGLGCAGCGYQLVDNGSTLLLYITDITKAS